MAARLPTPGADKGQWGDVLNSYLLESHNADGTLKPNSITAVQLAAQAVTESKLSTSVQTKLNSVAGTPGAPGPQGPEGPIGPQGSAGTAGPVGPQGPAGVDGRDGVTGAIGPQGPVGPAGAPGVDGVAGSVGPEGPQGLPGTVGPQGNPGVAGAGVPTGGTTGQVLAKTSGADYATAWVAQSGGGAVTVANLPAGSVLYARYNSGTSTWPARPTARTDIMVHWIGNDGSTAPPAAISGLDIWDWVTP